MDSPNLNIDSFAFRYACYDQLGWDYNQVAGLPDTEARKLAVVFEEVAAYQYKQYKQAQSGNPMTPPGQTPIQTGMRPGFEEDFSFGSEDDTDYGLSFKEEWAKLLESDPD